MNPHTFMARLLAAGLLLVILLLAAVFCAGQTFGQRCIAKGYPDNSPKFHECVQGLSQ